MEILMSLLLMLGGVAVFMYGMKQMSTGLEQSTGTGVKTLFKKLNKNALTDYGVGIATTAIVQSSSATSIMTIGLANAGIVNEKQGAGIILGAKVGTTLTAFIFALSGVSKGGFSIGSVFSFMAFIGVIISMTTTKDSMKKLSLFLIGFGMLFLGLEVMEFAIGGKDSVLSLELSKIFAYDVMQNPILLLVLGILFTFIIQSSTAATGIFIAFLKAGTISSIDQSFFLVMGANIGTCSDGIMASFGSNVSGKRIALFHVLTSTIGALFFTIVLMIFRAPIVSLFDPIAARPEWALVIYNLVYNTIYTLILLTLLNPLVSLVQKAIKPKPLHQTQSIYHIDERLLATPSMAISQTLREVYNMSALAKENLTRAFEGLIEEDTSQSKKIANDEYLIDSMTSTLANYIIKVSSCNISYSAEKLMGGLHHVISDMERIGDHAVTFAKETNFMKQQDLHFPEDTKTELKNIYQKITDMYDLSLETFKTRKSTNLKQISAIQQEISDLINQAKNAHTTRLNSGEYSVETSKSLYTILLSIQRVADHLVNLAFSIHSQTGNKTEAFKKLNQQNS